MFALGWKSAGRIARTCIAAAISTLAVAGGAQANPEPPALSDGRSVGMAGVGIATNDYATAPYHNPAGLSSVKKMTVTLAFTPFLAQLNGPFVDPATGQSEQHHAETTVAPLGSAAFGVRVHERIVVGFATFLTAGSGARYESVLAGKDVSGNAFAGEAQIPVAVSITDRLSVGAAYRITGASITLDGAQPAPAPFYVVDVDASANGFNFLGFSLGARYRLTDTIRLGALYRSKVVVDLDGDSTVSFQGYPLSEGDPGLEFPLPHTFKLGSEVLLLEKKLLIALDGAYWMYSSSHEADDVNGRPEGWKDSVAVILGAEYWLTETLAARLGGQVGTSATSDGAANPIGIQPGMIYTFGAGGGLRLEQVDLDLAAGVTLLPKSEVSADDNPDYFGAYHGSALFASLSANFHL